MNHCSLSESRKHRPFALVVDDEPVIADTLVTILKAEGFVAAAAYDGESALRLAGMQPPELLITDVVMPGISGVELAIAVKQIAPGCVILLFSGQAATADMLAEARVAGHHFTLLTKPVHPAELLAKVSSLGINPGDDAA